MEAEVLNRQAMMADVNGNNKLGTAELEVLKLQELVRKLEKENEQLRTRANAVNNRSHLHAPLSSLPAECDAPSPARAHPFPASPAGPAEEPIAYFQPSSGSPDAAEDSDASAGGATVLDEVEVLDLDTLLPVGDPETWMYVNPKVKPRSESALSTLQWRRQVLDNPGPELKLAKLKFLHRLDQAKWRRGVSPVRPYSCTEGLTTLSSPVLPYNKPAALTETPAPSPSSGPSFLQSTPPLRASSGLADRAPTFLSNSTPHKVGRRQAAVTPQSSVDSEVGVSELEYDSISMGYKLEDMTDVVVMARLQEESLREECASTSATASRRSSTFSLHSLRRSGMDLEEEDEEDEGYDQLPPPQPRLFRGKSMQRASLPHSHTFSSIRDCRRNSTTSQFSLSGLPQYSGPSSLITETPTAYRNSSDKLRRSMPNLIRAPSMPSVPSMPCLASPVNPPSCGPSSLPVMPSLRSSQSFDSSNGLARLQSSIPFPGQLSQRVQSVGNFSTTARRPLKATAYVNPTVQQNPTSSALPASMSLHSIPNGSTVSHSLQPSSSLLPQSLKATLSRSSLSRPASFVGTNGIPRASHITQPTRSLLTPPKSLAAMSALRDSSWKDGCF